jgi:hypothetical protein
MARKFIREAIRKPGRVREHLKREYGEKAFDAKGRIKMEYLDKAIKGSKEEHNVDLERALVLAKNLKSNEKSMERHREERLR